MKSITARFRTENVTSIQASKATPPRRTLLARTVYSNDPEHPNHVFSIATPSGTLELVIDNPFCAGFLEAAVGKELDVVITVRD